MNLLLPFWKSALHDVTKSVRWDCLVWLPSLAKHLGGPTKLSVSGKADGLGACQSGIKPLWCGNKLNFNLKSANTDQTSFACHTAIETRQWCILMTQLPYTYQWICQWRHQFYSYINLERRSVCTHKMLWKATGLIMVLFSSESTPNCCCSVPTYFLFWDAGQITQGRFEQV